MALTLDKEQRLEAAGLVKYFNEHKENWLAATQQSYDFVKGNFPEGANVRPDDVAKALLPIVEVNEDLRDELNTGKLSQKYWLAFFTDLIIDRVWNEISGEKK